MTDETNEEPEIDFRITPKGVVIAVLSDHMDKETSREIAEVILDRLYRHAISRCYPNMTPLIAFMDGSWSFFGGDFVSEEA